MGQIVSEPKVNISKIPDARSILNVPQKIICVGQKVAAGSATAGALVEGIANGGAENALFGETSIIAAMIRAAKAVNQETQIDAISLDDAGAAVAAAGTIAFTVAPSAAGQYIVNIGSRENHSYTIDVAATDVVTDIGDALVAAISADTKAPVTGVNTAGSVAITAVNKGTAGNGIGLEVQGAVAGVTVTVTGMASGATDPTLTNVFDVVGSNRYQSVIFPSEYGFDFVTDDFLDDRFNVDNAVLSGQAFCGKTDTLANLKTAGNAENSPSLVIFGNEIVNDTFYKGSAMFELNHVIAGYVAGIKALRLTEGANLVNIVANSTGSRDKTGGMHMASLPYFNTPLVDLPLIDTGKGFTQPEITELLATGISIVGNNTANTGVLLAQTVTAYKTDAQANADNTWKYLNYVNTGEAITEYIFNNIKLDFAQSRLTEGDLIGGLSMANKAFVTAKMVEYYSFLSTQGLMQAGEDALKYFKDNLIITLTLATGRVDIEGKVAIVTQARLFIIPLKISFSIS